MSNPYNGPPVYNMPVVPLNDYQYLQSQLRLAQITCTTMNGHNVHLRTESQEMAKKITELMSANAQLSENNKKLKAQGDSEVLRKDNDRLGRENRELHQHLQRIVRSRDNQASTETMTEPFPVERSRTLTFSDTETIYDCPPVERSRTLTLTEPEAIYDHLPVTRSRTLTFTETETFFELIPKTVQKMGKTSQTMPVCLKGKKISVIKTKSVETQTTEDCFAEHWYRMSSQLLQDNTPLIIEARKKKTRKAKKSKGLDARYPVSKPPPQEVELEETTNASVQALLNPNPLKLFEDKSSESLPKSLVEISVSSDDESGQVLPALEAEQAKPEIEAEQAKPEIEAEQAKPEIEAEQAKPTEQTQVAQEGKNKRTIKEMRRQRMEMETQAIKKALQKAKAEADQQTLEFEKVLEAKYIPEEAERVKVQQAIKKALQKAKAEADQQTLEFEKVLEAKYIPKEAERVKVQQAIQHYLDEEHNDQKQDVELFKLVCTGCKASKLSVAMELLVFNAPIPKYTAPSRVLDFTHNLINAYICVTLGDHKLRLFDAGETDKFRLEFGNKGKSTPQKLVTNRSPPASLYTITSWLDDETLHSLCNDTFKDEMFEYFTFKDVFCPFFGIKPLSKELEPEVPKILALFETLRAEAFQKHSTALCLQETTKRDKLGFPIFEMTIVFEESLMRKKCFVPQLILWAYTGRLAFLAREAREFKNELLKPAFQAAMAKV